MSVLSTAWGVISASANLVIGTKQMTEKAHRLLQGNSPSFDGLSKQDRAKLLSLQVRLECLVQPLNTLLLWCIDKDSTVQPVIVNAMQTMENVVGFLLRLESRGNGGSSGSGGPSGVIRSHLVPGTTGNSTFYAPGNFPNVGAGNNTNSNISSANINNITSGPVASTSLGGVVVGGSTLHGVVGNPRGSGESARDAAEDSAFLSYYLQEMDFACSSVGMALSYH